MKMPLCSFCIKSGIYCQKCQGKIESGQIGKTDVIVAKILMSLEEEYSSLQGVTFHNAYEVEGVLAIVVGDGDRSSFIGNNDRIIREISQRTGKKVRIIEKNSSDRRFLEDLFDPANITTINKIWLPDGTTETRVILQGYPRRLPVKSSVMKKLVKSIRGITLRIAYEGRMERIIR